MIISLVDNFIHVPILYTPAFYLTIGILQEHSLKETIDTMLREYWPTLTLCWGMWIPLQAINFSIIPLRYQVLFVNISCLIWNVALDFVAHGGFTTNTDTKEFINKCHSHCDHDRPVSYRDIKLHTHHNRGEAW
mmetsp:Transcript_4289/g.3490  ORF Transcript_4289/g.3490 Transcript_4289/m.3490 type:complete len:134 (+) Transcript_4289:290-691(+)